MEVQDLPTATCSADVCAADLVRDGRRWRILATRTANFVDFAPLSRACAEADIVISDRRLPRTCIPRWIKADRAFLARTGGISFNFQHPPQVSTVAERSGRYPWSD